MAFQFSEKHNQYSVEIYYKLRIWKKGNKQPSVTNKVIIEAAKQVIQIRPHNSVLIIFDGISRGLLKDHWNLYPHRLEASHELIAINRQEFGILIALIMAMMLLKK